MAASTPGGESSGTYMEVSATAPPPMDVDAGEPTAAGGGEGNVLTSILFGSGKDGEASSTVEHPDVAAVGAAASAEGSPEKEGGVFGFIEKVAVAVGLVSSDDEDEGETKPAADTAAAAATTNPAAAAT